MVTLHTGRIDDKNTQNTQKHTRLTQHTQYVDKTLAADTQLRQTHTEHTMRIKCNKFHKRINISNTYIKLRIKKKRKYLPPFAMFTFYRK